MNTEENDQENSGKVQESPGNSQESAGKSRKLPEIIEIMAERPELRRQLIKWVRSEFGFNIESYLENYFDVLPDKIRPIEELKVPLGDIVEDIFQMEQDGFSPSQIAAQILEYYGESGKLNPSIVAKVLNQDRAQWQAWIEDKKKRMKKAAVQKVKRVIPWYLRPFARIIK